MIDQNERGAELARAHWENYVARLLVAHGIDETTIGICKIHSLTAQALGYQQGYAEAWAEFQKGEDDGTAE